MSVVQLVQPRFLTRVTGTAVTTFLLCAASAPQAAQTPPGLQRLDYGANSPAALAAPVEHDSQRWPQLELEGATDEWDFGDARREVLPNGAQQVLALHRDAAVRIEIPIQMTFHDGAQVQLDLIVRGEDITVASLLLNKGEELARATLKIEKAMRAQQTVFNFPMLPGQTLRADRLVLEFPAGRLPVGLTALAIEDLELGGHVPAAAFGGMALVEVASDGRRATCIESGGAGHKQRFLVQDPKQVLRFSHVLPERFVQAGAQPELLLSLESDGVETQQHTFQFERSPTGAPLWKEESVALGSLLNHEVSAHFELIYDGPGSRLAVLGEAHLVLPMPTPPSVLLVTSSSQRADHVGYAGSPDSPATPFLDSLAADGRSFLNATATTNGSLPSHIAILTGVPAGESGYVMADVPLDPAVQTLAEQFAQQGYATLAVVSADVLNSLASGLGQGFDRYSNPDLGTDRDSAASVAQLERWLADYTDRPLFVWLHINDASEPYDPPKAILNRYYPEDLNPHDPASPVASLKRAPAWDPTIADPMYTEALYDAEVTFLDGVLGEFIERTRFKDSALAYTADHGETLRKGLEQRFSHRGLSGANLAVPLLFKGPRLASGAPSAAPVQESDVGRSLLKLAGLQAASFPGRDLLGTSSVTDQARFAIEQNGASGALQLGTWLLRIELDQPGTSHHAQLFDLSRDQNCQGNLAAYEAERFASMRLQLTQWLRNNPAGRPNWIDPGCTCPDCKELR